MHREVAVLVPCFNEELTVAKVVEDFRASLPGAKIYVYDNASTDGTAAVARAAGAQVLREKKRGKGNVVLRMFEQVDADYYLMVDGDDTYPAERAKDLLEPLLANEADMVVGTRLASEGPGLFRRFHVLGNWLVRGMINWLFGSEIQDVMSGYRGFTREFVRSVPLVSRGFEIETELTVQALDKGFVIREVPVEYRARPQGSTSKLRTFGDGWLVLSTIVRLFKDFRPLAFCTAIASFLFVAGLIPGLVVVVEFLQTSYIAHVPSAIFAVGSILLSFLFFMSGLILDTINARFHETWRLTKRLAVADIHRNHGQAA
jgi:glycosyltransferase involved in cell wall biosynthesis